MAEWGTEKRVDRMEKQLGILEKTEIYPIQTVSHIDEEAVLEEQLANPEKYSEEEVQKLLRRRERLTRTIPDAIEGR